MSSVLRFPPASPSQSVAYLQAKLAYYTDAWDLAEDLSRQVQGIVVVDARQAEAYRGGHICGAISFPHREMNEASTARLDRNKVYVTYCDGIGCNGSTKAAHQLALLGFQVKELTGGWISGSGMVTPWHGAMRRANGRRQRLRHPVVADLQHQPEQKGQYDQPDDRGQ